MKGDSQMFADRDLFLDVVLTVNNNNEQGNNNALKFALNNTEEERQPEQAKQKQIEYAAA